MRQPSAVSLRAPSPRPSCAGRRRCAGRAQAGTGRARDASGRPAQHRLVHERPAPRAWQQTPRSPTHTPGPPAEAGAAAARRARTSRSAPVRGPAAAGRARRPPPARPPPRPLPRPRPARADRRARRRPAPLRCRARRPRRARPRPRPHPAFAPAGRRPAQRGLGAPCGCAWRASQRRSRGRRSASDWCPTPGPARRPPRKAAGAPRLRPSHETARAQARWLSRQTGPVGQASGVPPRSHAAANRAAHARRPW